MILSLSSSSRPGGIAICVLQSSQTVWQVLNWIIIYDDDEDDNDDDNFIIALVIIIIFII